MLQKEQFDQVVANGSTKVGIETSSKGARPMEDVFLLDGDLIDLTGAEERFYRDKVGTDRSGKPTYAEYFVVSATRGNLEIPVRFYPSSIFKKVYEVDENKKAVATHRAGGSVQEDLKISKNLAADLIKLAKEKGKIRVSKESDIQTLDINTRELATASVCQFNWEK